MLPQIAQNFLTEMVNKNRKPSTIKRYNADLRVFLNWLSDYRANSNLEELETYKSLTNDDITAYLTYLTHKKYSPDTTRRLASVLRGLLTYLNINTHVIPKRANVAVKRDLNRFDFITDEEWLLLLRNVQNISITSTRYILKDRNISILILLRFYGLSASEIHRMEMRDINFAQQTLTVRSEAITRTLSIKKQDIELMIKYFNCIPKMIRPRYWSSDPFFVSYYNQTKSFHYDYQKSEPKRLSVRGIQKMIKDETEKAGMRNVSSTNLRNTCILDMLKTDAAENNIVLFFGLSNNLSLSRYMKYIKMI